MSRRKSSRKTAKSKAELRKLVARLPKIRGSGDRTARLNALLVDLRSKTERQLEYWKVFQQYLVSEREERSERIKEALLAKASSGYENSSLVRIVDTRYHLRPLSSFGSVAVPPGGRFNFGEISAYHKTFQALYLASDFQTAAAERFLKKQVSSDSVDQESLDFRLDPDASFSSYRVKVSNLTIIDIRDLANLQPFVDVIAEIEPPEWLIERASELRQPQPRTVKTADQLKAVLLQQNFTQYGSLIDQPSSSQWFGYYARASGIHGIIYDSVRDSHGYNLAVFPDNFGDTSAGVELIDEVEGVRSEDRILDGATAPFQMQSSNKKNSDSLH